ncbi:MAG: hypothetical protein IJ683_14590 [Butyrivibrio sp.]|nr:hypothetical protein [Butyrivibrio sp.]MBR1643536.1 hypothetical protein [Butyrivibrio sp.]
MTKKHYNELIELSQEIYDQAADRLNNYCASKYCGVVNDTMENQLEDYLFVAQETSAYFLGNAMALLDPNTLEQEIQTFVDNLRRVISFAQKKMGVDQKPN